ncbi:MAG: hypothetical protein ACTHN5_06865 [Phycisphaerae bacterium]
MSEEQAVKQETPLPVAAPKWPAREQEGVAPPATQARLAEVAARAAATNSRRDLVEYLRLRRKPA